MVVDAFPFFNELDILEIRLQELYPYVDKFVLVEAGRTQSLQPKPFYFEENKARFERFLDKIIHVKVEDCPDQNDHLWKMENFQRDCITRGVAQANPAENDLILISDVDEIPHGTAVEYVKAMARDIPKFQVISIEMAYHVFYLNLVTRNKKWTGTVAVKYDTFKNHTPQAFRNNKDAIIALENAGWHLGNMGGKEHLYKKFFACIEPFDKSRILPWEEFSKDFDEKIKEGGSFLCSDDRNNTSIKLDKIALEGKNLPACVLENQEKYKHLIL